MKKLQFFCRRGIWASEFGLVLCFWTFQTWRTLRLLAILSDLALPLTNWTVLGPATQTVLGVFQFTDATATNGQGFYLLRSP